MTRLIQVPMELEVPDLLTDAETQALVGALRADAMERAVLRLWEQGEFSTREATEALGLDYESFLRLLPQRGLPADNAPRNLAWVEEFQREIEAGASA